MLKKYKFGVIGAGFMSTAIINGCINSKVLLPDQIIVSDVNESALDKISQIGVSVTTDNAKLVSESEFVLFAVKPQSLNDVLHTIKTSDCNKFISIMAGIKKERIKAVFPSSMVARCMPNTPCSIGCGAVAIDLSDYSEKNDIDFITKLFSSFSQVVLLDENKMNAVTGISGSAPAYFYLFLKYVIDAGVKNGLCYEDAKNLAVNTMIGAGKMVKNFPEKSLDDLINAVCSKGGTTIEAVKVFNENDLDNITLKAVNACVKRSTELENI